MKRKCAGDPFPVLIEPGNLNSIVAYLRALDGARPERGLGQMVNHAIIRSRINPAPAMDIQNMIYQWFGGIVLCDPDDPDILDYGLTVWRRILRMAYPDYRHCRHAGGFERCYEPYPRLAAFMKGMYYQLVYPRRPLTP